MTSKGSVNTKIQPVDPKLSSQRPRGEYVYKAIILTLFVHIFGLGVSYLLLASPAKEVLHEESILEEVEITVVELTMPTPEEIAQSTMSEEVRNLVASANSERVKELVNYRGKSQDQIAKEVSEELAQREADERALLKQNHQSVPKPDLPQKDKNTSTQRESYDHVIKGSDKSNDGNVAVIYDLIGRKPTNGQPKPTYRCKTGGKVVVKIDVDQTGAVTSAVVDESKSTASDCLREDSLKYALKWRFDYGKDRKQSGSITFTFAAQ